MNTRGKANVEQSHNEEHQVVAGRGRGRPPKALSLVPVRELADRAAVAEQYHENARMCLVQSAGWAALAGLELVAARDACDEGQFEGWVEANCSFGKTTAWKYITLSDELKTRIENEEDCQKFVWLLERTPATLDKKQQTMLLGMMEKVTKGRTLQQLYFEFGITKGRDGEKAEKKEPRREMTLEEQKEWATNELGKLVGYLVMDVSGQGAHMYLKARSEALLAMADNLDMVATKLRKAAK